MRAGDRVVENQALLRDHREGEGELRSASLSLYLSLSLLKRNCGICLWCSVNLHPETKEQDLNKNRLLAAARCIRRQEQGVFFLGLTKSREEGGGQHQEKRNGKRRSW